MIRKGIRLMQIMSSGIILVLFVALYSSAFIIECKNKKGEIFYTNTSNCPNGYYIVDKLKSNSIHTRNSSSNTSIRPNCFNGYYCSNRSRTKDECFNICDSDYDSCMFGADSYLTTSNSEENKWNARLERINCRDRYLACKAYCRDKFRRK